MWYVLCAVVCAALMVDGESCHFPEQLKSRSRWETHMIKERIRTNAYYKFHSTKMEVRDYASDVKRMQTWLCEEQRTEDTYVLKLDEINRGGNEQFMCVQFVRRSAHIYQQRVSKVLPSVTPSICDELQLDDWPLVWPELSGDQYSECPIQGGFTVDVREYLNDVPVCENRWLTPRLESECITGEGIKLDFRHIECKASLSMDLVQKLACLGTWQQDGFIFTILTDQDDLWPKLWMLRIPDIGVQQELHTVLSMDIVADRAEYFGNNGLVPLERLFELVLKTELYPSLCENEANNCDRMCESSNELFCQKQCGVCEPVHGLHHCRFDSSTHGQWLEVNDDGSRSITITESMLYTEDLIPFQCYELYADSWFVGTGRKALATLFKNGCKPRYTCAEFQMKSPDVMTYRLSQSLVWPATLNVNAEDVCAENMFKIDAQPLVDKYRSKMSKILVKQSSQRHTVPCGISSSVGLSGVASDGSSLLGVLWNTVMGYETVSHSIMHEVCDGGDTKHALRTLKCLASYHEDNNTQIVIVEDENVDVECWVFHRNVWERQQRAYVLQPAYCNPDMPYQIDFANSSRYKARYDLVSLDGNAPDPCSKWTGRGAPKPTVQHSTAATVDHDVNIISASTVLPKAWKIKVSGLSGAQKTSTSNGYVLVSLLIGCLLTAYA